MSRRENTFRVDYSQFPKLLTHDEIHNFVGKELGLTREDVLQLQPSRRLKCTFVKVNNPELAEQIVERHDNKHEFVFDGKAYKLRIMMEDGAVEVKLFDLPEGVTNEHVADFLATYGEVISVRDLLWDDRYSDFGGIKTGVRVVRMIVSENIPSLVTIQGELTSVGYKGQRQTCMHCHEFAHIGIPCVQNKKLLVQKLAADQSYAKVVKGNPPQNKPTPIQPPPNKTLPQSKPLPRKSSDPRKPSSGTSVPNLKVPSPVEIVEKRPTATLQNIPMPPPAAPAHTLTNNNRKTDGNETDSSQTSQVSTCIRRSRRQPPGKKMRPSGNEENTFEHTEHVQNSFEIQQ